MQYASMEVTVLPQNTHFEPLDWFVLSLYHVSEDAPGTTHYLCESDRQNILSDYCILKKPASYSKILFVPHTLIKFWQNNKVNLATLAFGATLAQIKRDVKQVEQFPELTVLILAEDFQRN